LQKNFQSNWIDMGLEHFVNFFSNGRRKILLNFPKMGLRKNWERKRNLKGFFQRKDLFQERRWFITSKPLGIKLKGKNSSQKLSTEKNSLKFQRKDWIFLSIKRLEVGWWIKAQGKYFHLK